MTHSYRLHYFHLIWSTKQRLPHISSDVQSRLYPYLGAITRNHSGKLLEIGGMSDHVHLLIELSLLDKFSHFIRDLKASSSQWIHKNFPIFMISLGKRVMDLSLLVIQLCKLYKNTLKIRNNIMLLCLLRRNILNF
jgi:REP element-mobilizing transposase RayT